MQDAIDWARDNAPDLAESIERELNAPRDDRGETVGEQHQRPQRIGGEPVLSLSAIHMTDASGDRTGESSRRIGGSGRDSSGNEFHDENDSPTVFGRFRPQDLAALTGFDAREPNVLVTIVADAVSMLGSDEQDAFRMVYGEGLSYRDAADHAGVSLGTIQYRLDKVKAAIRERLSRGDEESAA